jgi:hypothetical protein
MPVGPKTRRKSRLHRQSILNPRQNGRRNAAKRGTSEDVPYWAQMGSLLTTKKIYTRKRKASKKQ